MLPVIWGIIAAGASFLGGAAIRQPEINKLHNQIEILQEEICKLKAEVKRLNSLVDEQNRQINVLTLKYHTMKSINFIEKVKAKNKAKGAVMYSYCMKQFLELKYNILNKEYYPDNDETLFMDSFNSLLEGRLGNSNEDIAKMQHIKIYIRSIYASEIDSLEECPIQNTLKRIEGM